MSESKGRIEVRHYRVLKGQKGIYTCPDCGERLELPLGVTVICSLCGSLTVRVPVNRAFVDDK